MISTFEHLPEGKKIYFASDFHLGVPDPESSLAREKKIVSWLTQIQKDAFGIFLVGDIFDFWFEYKHTIPKGFSRLLGKLAELTDSGISVVIFTGNHDMWMFDYFENEFGITVHRSTQVYNIGGKQALIGHGDGLGPGDRAYKVYKKIFSNPVCQVLFEWLHPNIGMSIARFWSGKSRMKNNYEVIEEEAEWLIQYCRGIEEKAHHDYYIFGHRHVATELNLNDNSSYFNLGEWVEQCTYAVFSDGRMSLKKYPS